MSPDLKKVAERLAKEHPGIFRIAANRHPVTLLSTGILTLDRALGGGIAINRLNLIAGRKESFKTTLTLKLAKRFLEACPVCLNPWGSCERCKAGQQYIIYVDTEHTFNNDYLVSLGINPEYFFVYQSPYGEAAADYCLKMLPNPQVGGIIVDSNDGLYSLSSTEEGFLKSKSRGDRAVLINRFTRQLSAIVDQDAPKIALMTNHLLSNVGMFAGSYIPGGEGQIFFSSTVLHLWRASVSENRINLDDELKKKKKKNDDVDVDQVIEEVSREEEIESESGKVRKQEVGFLIQYSKTSKANISGSFSLMLESDDTKGWRFGDSDDGTLALNLGLAHGIIQRKTGGYEVVGSTFKKQSDITDAFSMDKEFHDRLYRELIRIPTANSVVVKQ